MVDVLNGVKLTSLQYCVYCATILSGIIVVMRFGILRRFPSARESSLWPKGRSVTMRGLVIKSRSGHLIQSFDMISFHCLTQHICTATFIHVIL